MAEQEQRNNLFHTKGVVKERCIRIIIDGGSCNNLASVDMVEKLALQTKPHPRPYYIQWFNNSGKVKISRTVRVHFTIASYTDFLDCDVVLCKNALFYLVDLGNLIKMLFIMVVQISILLCTRIIKLRCFL